jgi:hypothetical protein
MRSQRADGATRIVSAAVALGIAMPQALLRSLSGKALEVNVDLRGRRLDQRFRFNPRTFQDRHRSQQRHHRFGRHVMRVGHSGTSETPTMQAPYRWLRLHGQMKEGATA